MSEQLREPENSADVPAVPIELLPPDPVGSQDKILLQRLRGGDEAAFAFLIEQYHLSMERLARFYVSNPLVVEEVVQEAWLAVIRGLSRFEERCSLKTWIFRILRNIAITRAQHENRSIPFSSLVDEEGESFEPAFDARGAWVTSPHSWVKDPEERLLSKEIRRCIQSAIEALPIRQREVIILRDLEGWSAGEVSELLEVSEGNQRVLLHRARSRVRRALDQYLSEDGEVEYDRA